jgi:hypothetical protein
MKSFIKALLFVHRTGTLLRSNPFSNKLNCLYRSLRNWFRLDHVPKYEPLQCRRLKSTDGDFSEALEQIDTISQQRLIVE